MPVSVSSPASRPAARRASSSAAVLRTVRQLHLYIGLFISPALLFFAFTGAIQTLDLHSTRPGNAYRPPAWILPLAQLHKKQTLGVPAEDKQAAAPRAANAPHRSSPVPSSLAHGSAFPREPHLPMKLFFLLVSLGLFTSTITGIVMAWKYKRSKVAVIGALLAGVVIPLVLLRF